jgi:hypothetical protein
MSSRTTPADVNLTYYTCSTLPAVAPGTFVTGTTAQYQVWSDRGVWDTTNNVYLYPGIGFNPYLLFGD